jgi:hypothetical protein
MISSQKQTGHKRGSSFLKKNSTDYSIPIRSFPLDLSHWKLDKEKKDIEHCIISLSNP